MASSTPAATERARNAGAGGASRRNEGFRPDLEGLRAVAVVLVVLYHAGLGPLPGGYVGVDVFFVLSGFLITGLIARELARTGSVSLGAFYARRVRRLLPAALLVLLVTIVASAAVLPPLQVPDVANDVTAAALYVSNMRFALNATDYLRSDVAPSPVLHYWSLGVEEQFYLFWPAIVLLVAGGARAARGRTGVRWQSRERLRSGPVVPIARIGLAAAVISAVSFGLALWLTTHSQPWAFFSLPARAWQLGIGALLAVSVDRLARIPRAVAAGMGWIGLGAVVLAGVVLTGATPYPGVAAVLPTAGSALVIAAGAHPNPMGAGRILGTAIPGFLGRISYSLYLWHWPLLVLPAVATGRGLTIPERGGLVALAVLLAYLTLRLVEDPIRHGRFVGTVTRRNLATAGAFSLILAVASFGIGNATLAGLKGEAASNAAANEANVKAVLGSAGVAPPTGPISTDTGAARGGASSAATSPSPAATQATAQPSPTLPPTADRAVPANLTPSLADAHTDLPVPYVQGCNIGFDGTRSPDCVYGNPSGATTVVLFGDSHALSWFPAVNQVALERGWRLVDLTKSGCGSADVPQYLDALGREYTECAAWRTSAFARIAAEHPAMVILTNSRSLAVVDPKGAVLRGDPAVDLWQAGLLESVKRLVSIGTKTVVISDTPRAGYDTPVCLSQHRDSILACATPYRDAVSQVWRSATATAAAQGGATLIDPARWVCPSDPCPPVISNLLVYRDQQHLATPFSAALAAYLGPELSVEAK